MLVKGSRATASETSIGNPESVVICVPTPLSAESAPDLSTVRGAAGMTGRLLQPGMLVVLAIQSEFVIFMLAWLAAHRHR